MKKDDYCEKRFTVIKSESSQLGRFVIHMDTILEGGSEHPYSFISEPNSVGILPFFEGKVILERQYRHTFRSYEYEIPGGAIDEGEDPVSAAKRELLEETGFSAKKIIYLGSWYMAPGVSTAENFMYAVDCEKGYDRKLEPLEFIHIEMVSIEEFIAMLKSGKIKQSLAFVGWQKYQLSDEKIEGIL